MNHSGDQILIQELELIARVGVTDEERATPQPITLSLVLQPRRAFDKLRDELSETVDYAEVCAELERFVSSRSWKLIETLAHELAEHLLDHFDTVRVELELRKFVLHQTRFVAARVVRLRDPKRE